MWKFLNRTLPKPLLQYLVYYLLLALYINKLFKCINIEVNTNATFTNIQINHWNKLRQHKGHRYFWMIVPRKTQCGKTCEAYMRVLLLRKFLNTTRVPKMAHRSKIILGSSTFLQRQIFRLISNRMIGPTVTSIVPHLDNESCSKLSSGTASPSRDCVTLLQLYVSWSTLNLPHRITSAQPLKLTMSSASASMASTSASLALCVLCASLSNLYVNPCCLCVSLPRLCTASSSTLLPLWYVSFSLG